MKDNAELKLVIDKKSVLTKITNGAAAKQNNKKK